MSLLSDIESATTTAWVNSPPIVGTAQREPNHVARWIAHVSQPIADSIVSHDIARGASVRATFCHQNPYAFWAEPSALGGVARRELGDLLLIVRTPSMERALLLQTKMSGLPAPSPWEPGIVVGVANDEQRRLYAQLPPFHLEFSQRTGQPTAAMARKEGSVDLLAAKRKASGSPMLAYELSGCPNPPAAMIYAWIDGTHTNGVRTPGTGKWSAWLTEPHRPIANAQTTTLSASLAETLEGLICSPSPAAGMSCAALGPCPHWSRLVQDLEQWALQWFTQTPHTRNFDVSTANGIYDPKVYNNLGTAFMTWTTAGPRPALQALPGVNRAWPVIRMFPRSRRPLHLVRHGEAGPPERPVDASDESPPGGFGVLEIRLSEPQFEVG